MAENPTQNGAGPEKRAQARKSPSYSEQQKADALALVQEHGLAEGARRAGIPKTTLVRWAEKAGVHTGSERTRAANEARAETWEKRRLDLKHKLGQVAAELVEKARAAEARDAQSFLTATAIAIDKAELLSGRATSREEHVRRDRVDAAVLELEEMLNTNGNGHG